MILGLVVAKSHSERFPDKNVFPLHGEPLFWHSVKPLLECKSIDRVCVFTDSKFIGDYCEKRHIPVIWRAKNAARDDESLFSVIQNAYRSLDEEFEIVVTIMANCPGHQPGAVERAIELTESKSLMEVRSFNDEGEESGIIVLRKEVLVSRFQISTYLGCVNSHVKEIHYRKDLDVEH